jgi:lipopolysaccharide biosynthesis glycosyltransferase
MDWFCALTEDNHLFPQYSEMVMVAVYTARRFTSLRPHLVYDGNDNEFTRWLDRHGVKILRHRSLFREELVKLGEREKNPHIATAVSGAFLRVELPRLLTSDLILYTDCDVIFRDEVVRDLRSLPCDYFSVAPHRRESYDDVINSGVMLMNLRRLRETADEFYQFIFDRLDELKAQAWDQGAYRRFYRDGNGRPLWNWLPLELNWRPYWGCYDGAKIIHFHGPKPYQRDGIDAFWPELKAYTGGAYLELIDVWQKLLEEARGS